MRKRNIELKVRVTGTERDLIYKRMNEFGTENMNAYMRKMAIDGRIIIVDMPEINDAVTLLGRCSSLLNQIAVRVNESNRIYQQDILDMQQQQDKMWAAINDILSKLAFFDA